MGAHLSELNPHESVRHFFGAELRHRRLAAGLSQAVLAQRVIAAPALVNKVELAVRFPSSDLAGRCDDVLAADGALVRLHKFVLAERAQTKAPADAPVVLSGPEARALRRLLASDRADGQMPARALIPDVLDRIDLVLATSSPGHVRSAARRLR